MCQGSRHQGAGIIHSNWGGPCVEGVGGCREHLEQRGLNLASQGSHANPQLPDLLNPALWGQSKALAFYNILEHPSLRTAGTEPCPTSLESGYWDEFLEDTPRSRVKRGILGRRQPGALDTRGGGRGLCPDREEMRPGRRAVVPGLMEGVEGAALLLRGPQGGSSRAPHGTFAFCN